MNRTKDEVSVTEQGLTDKNRLSEIITDWAAKNKKIFWKYEVSCFYKTYVMKIKNMPSPSVNDIHPVSISKLLSEVQKKQLCDAVTKACGGENPFKESSIDVEIDCDDGRVTAEVL